MTTAERLVLITEAQTALHSLATGSAVVRISSPDGTMIEYQQRDIAKVTAYLSYLQSLSVSDPASSFIPGPIYVLPPG